jgi:SNF2 family DNA or RNA helicase
MIYKEAQEEAFGSLEEACPICQDVFEMPLQTNCKHIFCRDCILPWVDGKSSQCPICRTTVRRNCFVIPKGWQMPAKKEEKGMMEEDIMFSKKADVLIAEMKQHKCKAVVVSQFSSALKHVMLALGDAGISSVRLDASMSANQRQKTIDKFVNDAKVSVCLLPIRIGACGLNLQAASHLYLLDQDMDPARIRQAMQRVHRLGQTQKVTIHSLVMQNTVEEQILKINAVLHNLPFSEDGNNQPMSNNQPMANDNCKKQDLEVLRGLIQNL